MNAEVESSEAGSPRILSTRVCIAGGGPAGMMLGLLLARAGIDVVVLEKHADFFRDFRGDTVHPSTLNLIDQLGLREAFGRIEHTPLPRLDAVINGVRIHAIDFVSLPAPNRQITLMPQWDLLNLLADEASRSPHFDLRLGAEAVEVTRSGGRVTGVLAQTASGMLRIDAALTVAADGRGSTVRRALGLRSRQFGVPVDVAWFRLDRPAGGLPDTLGFLSESAFLVTIPRPEYLQCGLLIAKGSFGALQSSGLEAFRARIAGAAPRLRESAEGLTDWNQIKLLSVQIDRLRHWSTPGALCIGDSAHAMSPVFGVGINYAIQDAVAAANLLVPVLRAEALAGRGGAGAGAGGVRSGAALAAGDAPGGGALAAIDAAAHGVERRRALPTALMQRIQRGVHRTLGTAAGVRLLDNPPTPVQRVVLRAVIPLVRPLVARLVGYGFRPERISPDVLREGPPEG